MAHNSGKRGSNTSQAVRSEWIETFRSRSRLDLKQQWRRFGLPESPPFHEESWGRENRPDWADRGLLIWPRGRQWLRLEQQLVWPAAWAELRSSHARLVMSWWAERMRLWVDGALVHEGDLFDTACRWILPGRCRSGDRLHLRIELCSPLHDDGALILSHLDLEPFQGTDDRDGSLVPESLMLHLAAGGSLPCGWCDLDPLGDAAVDAVTAELATAAPVLGSIHWLGHAHLDLAWLWPVADTWLAAERTFRSVLDLMARWPDLRFAHSSPALYAWVERHRPGLFSEIRAASRRRSWEPINGPWVETDCVLVSTASLWQQFSLGQDYSRRTFPEWSHNLAWLPDSFGFAAGLPAVASKTGVRWFCTHKLAWNSLNPFPHRLFRWRSRGAGELCCLMLPPIGRRADPLEMLKEQRAWSSATGLEQALWIPGVGDHGGGPTEEMLEQMQLWEQQPAALPASSGTVRAFLDALDCHIEQLPVWQDELYLELHRGCSTSRPDQKSHNRMLERLLRELDAAAALLGLLGQRLNQADWRPLLFQQFHDILPGTSIPEVFEQAEPVWRTARRLACRQRDRLLVELLEAETLPDGDDPDHWIWCGLQPLARWSPVLRLPPGRWSTDEDSLPQQTSAMGGTWVQLPTQQGISSIALRRESGVDHNDCESGTLSIRAPVRTREIRSGIWRVGNGLLEFDCSAEGLLQLRDSGSVDQLAGPLMLTRYRDRGEFWDAWDLAGDYRDHSLEVGVDERLEWLELGELVAHLSVRRTIGTSRLRLDLRLQADTPWLELICTVEWEQRHELLRLEIPLASPAARVAADTSGGVIERPAVPVTPREEARWELPVISWFAAQSEAPGGGLAVLLDGPQGVDWTKDRLGISLLRGPTWPDPGADQGWHRQRLALMPVQSTWSRSGVPQAAIALREPGWNANRKGLSVQLFPPLPLTLCPVSLLAHEQGCLLRLLNPGPSRVHWCPGDGWRMQRRDEDTFTDDVMLGPGELAELLITQSW